MINLKLMADSVEIFPHFPNRAYYVVIRDGTEDPMFFIFMLALSVSLDTLGIGMAYAMAGIRIPNRTRILVASLNGVLTGLALLLGESCLSRVPKQWFQLVGGSILLILGVKTLWNALGENRAAQYDRDDSRSIDLREGCLLGLALALDSVSAALSIAGQGAGNMVFPFCTAFLCGFFLWVGERHSYNVRRLNGVSGVILLILGLLRLFPLFS